MTKAELCTTPVGTRVKLITPAGSCEGVVYDRARGVVTIVWDDTGGSWRLNPAGKFDRERALPITIIKPGD